MEVREKKRRKPDRRTQRSCDRLGDALLTLILEKPIADVTVQEVLDRASVGRSTFYLYYRDKGDLLLSQLEGFLEFMSSDLSVRQEKSQRVVPVAEMFAHIGGQNKLYRALGDSGVLHEFYDLAQGYFARGIERRLKEVTSGSTPRPALVAGRAFAAHAVALAGSLLSLLRWWLDRGGKETPQAMDELFHRIVWTGLQ